MANNAHLATIGQRAPRSTEVLIGWASARGLAAPAALLVDLLGARDAQIDYLGTIVERLASVAPVLSAWSEDAVELYGLARLANAFDAERADLASLPRRQTLNPVMQDFRGQAETHYLYMCWVVHGPVGQRSLEWISIIRAWLLVQALMRADRRVWLDDLLKDACLRVREACEETEDVRWLAAIERLQTRSDDWYRLTQHLHGAVDRFTQTPGEKEYAQRRNWLLVLRRIAAGDSRPRESDRPDRSAVPRDALDLPELDVSPLTGQHADDLRLIEPALGTGSWDDAEQDDLDGADLVAVDPAEAPALAQQAARQIQLLSGADARFLAWDWYVLTPPEQDALQRLIRRSLRAAELSDRVIAALVDLAQCLGRSLEMVGRVRLLRAESAAIGEEWAVDINSASVRRTCPRRPAHWRPDDRERPFINEFADVLTLPLPPGTAEVLRDVATRAPDTATIDQLWQALHQGPLESQFRRWCAQEPSLRRVTQGMLSQTLARAFFERSGDHVAARLLASAPRSGLPASTAYTAYRSSDLAEGLSATPASSSALNVAGGLLDPVADFLKEGFARAHQQLVSQTGTADFVGFHNAVTRYWDAVWRAATGIRPFAERWTDISLIEPTHGFVVVDDKSSLQDARTRLVPLPAGLWERFERSYIQQQLPTFRRWLEANGLRGGQSRSTGAAPDAQLRPLMFALVAERGSVKAVPIGSHNAPIPPESPLPANAYRHRLRTALHRRGVNPEVIDSIMGHQDGATATHGDYSMRVWRDDMKAVSDALRNIFDELEIRDPPAYDGELAMRPTEIYPTYQPLDLPSADTAQRSGPSWRLRLRAARTARRIITQALAPAEDGVSPSQSTLAKRLADLDPDALNRLSARLVTSPKGTPTTLGPLRYAYFLRLCDRAWETSNKRPSLRRRFLWRPRDASPYRAEAAKALNVRAALRKELESALEELTPSKLTRTDALWLALFDLGLCSGVSDPVLQSVLIEGKAIRLIELEGHAYLEWNSEGQVDTVRSPVQRLRITSRSAHALHNVMRAQRRHVDWQSSPPQRFGVLAQLLRDHGLLNGVGLRAVLAALNTVVDQCNVIELPGTVAAHLAGRVRSASLHWGDKLALRSGDRFDPTTLMRVTSVASTEATDISEIMLDADASTELQERPTVGLPVAATVSKTQAQIDARELFKKVRAELAQAEHARQGVAAKATVRRSAGRRINALVSATGSTAVTSLIHWCASLLVRPRGRGLLAISTVKRYFAALSPRFEAAAYESDLLSMDDEEIAELYASLMDLQPQSAADYAYSRLRDFHGFCEERFSVPDIDWSEVAPEKTAKLCAPGYVHERMYRRLLIEIRRAAPLPTAHSRTAAQALVVLGYRFGLRGAEACGLEVDDCHFDATPPWLSVKKNRLRELKSPAARRTIPLLTRLRPVERNILARMLDAARQATAGLPNAPTYLFLDPQGAGELLDSGSIKRTVNALIKDVTGQRHLSVHHLRHSFACNVWDGITAARVLAPAEEASTQATTLLGHRQQLGPTRRAPWALARLMGHAHPRTTLFSYIHILDEVVERLAFVGPVRDWKLPSHALLQVGQLQPQPRPRSEGRAAQDVLSGAQAFSMLMALDRGTDVERLPSRYPVTLEVARRMERIRQEVARRCDPKGEVSEVGLSPRAAAYLVHRGVLSHATQSRGPGLRVAIDQLFTTQNRVRLGEIRITKEEFCGLFGSKRNISMFRAAQFQLLRVVQDVIGIPQPQFRLAWRVNAKVKRVAIASQWLTVAAPDEQDADGVEFDRVRFDGNPVEHRVVVSLQRTEQGPIRNRWELIAVLLTTVPLLTFEAERD